MWSVIRWEDATRAFAHSVCSHVWCILETGACSGHPSPLEPQLPLTASCRILMLQFSLPGNRKRAALKRKQGNGAEYITPIQRTLAASDGQLCVQTRDDASNLTPANHWVDAIYLDSECGSESYSFVYFDNVSNLNCPPAGQWGTAAAHQPSLSLHHASVSGGAKSCPFRTRTLCFIPRPASISHLWPPAWKHTGEFTNKSLRQNIQSKDDLLPKGTRDDPVRAKPLGKEWK